MQFSRADLERANLRLAMCSFYPSDPGVQGAIMALLAQICPSLEALNWLTDTMVNRIGTWKGPAELRGILCWRYRPADGIEADSSSSGFTPADGEALWLGRASEPKGYLQ